jgi:hypothetical protein
MDILVYYRNISGLEGSFVKETYPTGKPVTIIVRLQDGRLFFAPKSEFTQINNI